LTATEIAKTSGKVIWGEAEGSPETPLQISEHHAALEAKAPASVRFPVVLTLLLRFPGMATTDRPELFTFPFSHYSEPGSRGH
jgi:hypothetical protein